MVRSKVGKIQFLAGFAKEGVVHIFAVVDVSTNGSVPFARLDIFIERAFLQIKFATSVKNVQVHHRMQQLASTVTFMASGFADNLALLVDDGEKFVVIHCFD